MTNGELAKLLMSKVFPLIRIIRSNLNWMNPEKSDSEKNYKLSLKILSFIKMTKSHEMIKSAVSLKRLTKKFNNFPANTSENKYYITMAHIMKELELI